MSKTAFDGGLDSREWCNELGGLGPRKIRGYRNFFQGDEFPIKRKKQGARSRLVHHLYDLTFINFQTLLL